MRLPSFIVAKVYKRCDFLHPVYKKVKTVTIFMGKNEACIFIQPLLIKNGLDVPIKSITHEKDSLRSRRTQR